MSKRGYPEGGFYDRRRDDRRDRRDDYDYDRRDRRDYGGHGYGGGSGSSYSYYGSGSGFSGSNGNGYHNDRDISRGYGAPSSSAARSSSARPSSCHREEVEWRPPSPLQAPAPPPAAAAAQAAPLTSSTEAAEELKKVLRQVLAARFKNKTAPCFCPFALRGLTPIYQGHREAYARLADYYGWPPDPTAGTQTHKAPCTSGEIKGLQALQQHADKQSAGCRRAVAAYDDDDDDADEEDPATATAHKALAEVLRETTRLPEMLPGSGPKAAAQKTESVSWPPMLYISGIKGVLEDSAGKLNVRFGKWGPDVQCPVYRGPFTGDAVLTFGTPGHAQLPPGSDDAVHLAQAQAFQNAKDLKAVLNSPGGAEAARGVRSARWVTEEEFAEWRSVKWAKDLVGNGRWGERMRVRWVNLREQEMKIADATKMRDQEMQRVVETANEERESAVAKAKEEEAKRLALEAAQAARDASLREHRIKVEELTRRLGKEEEQTLVAQEKQRAAEEKEREARKERDLMQRGADELTELMSSALAQKERELQAQLEKMRQLANGSAGAEAAKRESERLTAELQSTRDEKMKREREMKEEIAAKEEERKAAEEAAEGSEYQQYRNDHLYLKDMLVAMYEKISKHPKHEYAFSNGLHPFKTFGDVKGVGELLFPKGCNQMQKLEAECLDGYLQHGFWGETTMDAFPSWPPFSAAKVFKIKTETVGDKVVQEYLLVEKDEKMTGLMPIKDATGAVRFEVQELNELQYDAAFLRYVRKRFPKQADAFMGYLRGQYRDYCEKRGLGVHEDAVHRRLWNREQDREMTPAEIFAIFSALNE